VTTVASGIDGGHIRQAERADLLAVHRIEQDSFPQPWPFDAFEQYLGRPGFLVAVTDPPERGVVGYVVADSVPNGYRGQGIGTALLQRTLGVLRSQGVASVKLEVRESNDDARSLYREHGFEHRRTVPHYYDDGENALVMVRPL